MYVYMVWGCLWAGSLLSCMTGTMQGIPGDVEGDGGGEG